MPWRAVLPPHQGVTGTLHHAALTQACDTLCRLRVKQAQGAVLAANSTTVWQQAGRRSVWLPASDDGPVRLVKPLLGTGAPAAVEAAGAPQRLGAGSAGDVSTRSPGAWRTGQARVG